MVKFWIDPRRGELRVLGHAGFDSPGRDPVCAGVSVLVLTLYRRVAELGNKGAVEIKALAAEPGAALIRCRPNPGREQEVETVFRTIETGLTMLSQEYPEYVGRLE